MAHEPRAHSRNRAPEGPCDSEIGDQASDDDRYAEDDEDESERQWWEGGVGGHGEVHPAGDSYPHRTS